ncbi:MAG TPA: RsmB/NOP family class I SAM-dependent RNA methyltransferase [Pirellulaceae bacterium]|nr:RsmB/NOP family class I SAM-dependent RNA methyltransferase [Pirellulaceae bacterium]HMO92514.1 RsmB/NOP family class I SAM-dependent RNA methyltransferase [Pirellulaceae bacterium]HMP69003.1 RsmB/NOP family class I SAM-dependent RNA methyltransferase [Pirellulaceae bacterium]
MNPGLPTEFLQRLETIVPADWLSIVHESFLHPKSTSFRVNTLKCTPDIARQELSAAGIALAPIEWCEHAFAVPASARASITHHPLAENGGLYVQGLSSILASLLLDPQPGEQVLDLAAAPGGKANHLAALMKNMGWLSVVEPIRKRMFVLADNLKRAGVKISHTYLMDGRKVGDKVPGRFDRVMLDAPCSGEARFSIDEPETFAYWSPRKINEQARKQKALIVSAFKALRSGGRMLYCTCSFAPEENESIVDHLLQMYPDEARLVALDLPITNWHAGLTWFGNDRWSDQLQLARRILPNELFDGFFLARIEKN